MGQGAPGLGAVVSVNGTSKATVSDEQGRYSLKDVAVGATIVFTHLSFQPKQVVYNGQSELDVTLDNAMTQLDDVVVTALGIKREEKALSYNVQTVAGDELNTVASANFVNSLAGKVAGVQFNSSGGPGGAVKVVSRGTKSLQGDNNVLYVIDGVPMHNAQKMSTTSGEGGDYADPVTTEGIADLNPDDFENVTMLTGPAASALYGYEGANGVILITTKKGTADKTSVTFSNNTTFSNPFVLPKFQYSYLSNPNDIYSWGPKGKVSYNPTKFFQTGFNTTTSVGIQSGKGNNKVYFSAANTTAEGILPNNTYDRYNFSMRYSTSFLKDKMKFDASANYIIQNDKNMVSEGTYFNPLPATYLYPRANDFASLKDFEFYNEVSEVTDQKWGYNGIMESQNPYWQMNRMNRENSKLRYMFTASLQYDITDYLNIMGRVNVDNASLEGTWKFPAGTLGALSGAKGRYRYRTETDRQTYADVIANFNKRFGDFSVFVNAGGSIKDYRESNHLVDGNIPEDGGFTNIFTTANLGPDATNIQAGRKKQVQSVFANAELGWRSMLFLTLTARNDWDSSLALPGVKNRASDVSFLYPSVGLSVVFDQMFRMPKGFDFAKLRFSRTEVGSGLPGDYQYYTDDNRPVINEGGIFKASTIKGYIDPKNERTVSYEAGIDLRFLGGALTFDGTFYHSNTYNQTFNVPISASGGLGTSWLIQSGDVQNMGVELAIGFNKKWGDFGWNSGITYSYNKNTLKKLLGDGTKDPSTGEILLYNEQQAFAKLGGDGAPVIRLVTGGSISDMYIHKYKWQTLPNGALNINNDKVYADLIDEYENMGPMNAHSYAGFNNSFSYKGFGLSFQIRGRFGGWVYSATQAAMDYYGVSQYSAELRDKMQVKVLGQGVKAQPYLTAISEGGGKGKHYICDATNIRLGEIRLSYTMPRKWFNDVVGVTVSAVANNVVMLYNKAPFDPEQTANASYTYYNGVDNFMLPSTRNIGFNVKLQF
jgi:TonB-linked SusC/RagA family outer membrane protein